MPDLSAKSGQTVIRNNVKLGANRMTDKHGAFVGPSDACNHHHVNHSADEYVRHYILHTTGIESIWTLFKRLIIGTHHFAPLPTLIAASPTPCLRDTGPAGSAWRP